eukprot:UN00354
MAPSLAMIPYVALLILNHAYASLTGHDTFCVTGSMISSQVNGKYEYKGTNTNGFIHYNDKQNLYLFPWVQSDTLKQYLIGPDPTSHSAHSFSTIQALSPYRFNEEDFLTNWQSYVFTNNTNPPHIQLEDDKSMRLVSCTSVCVESILYEWITFNLSTQTSIYYNTSTAAYLYRSNIAQNDETWLLYDHENTSYETLSPQDINIRSCMNINITEETEDIPTYYNYATNNDKNVSKYGNKSKYGVIAVLFAAISLMFVVSIAIVSVIKYLLDMEYEDEKEENLNKNPKQTNSKPNKKAINSSTYTNNVQIRITTPSMQAFSSDEELGHINVRKITNSMTLQSWHSPRSTRSNSKYVDILPAGNPPPIGMRPVLTAKQQSNRPLPPTPTERKEKQMFHD